MCFSKKKYHAKHQKLLHGTVWLNGISIIYSYKPLASKGSYSSFPLYELLASNVKTYPHISSQFKNAMLAACLPRFRHGQLYFLENLQFCVFETLMEYNN